MILIIANARWPGGLSGGDNIYLNFARYWPDVEVWKNPESFRREDLNIIDFTILYIMRIIEGCIHALCCKRKYEFVYSASDFLMDSLPALILKLKGSKWVAGYYLHAPKTNKIYYYSQKFVRFLIRRYADVVCVTNESITLDKKEISVHGGVNLEHAGMSDVPRCYDAVFIGRFHHTKGIKELMQIWDIVQDKRPYSKLAVIGGGDDEEKEFTAWAKKTPGVYLFGYMGKERFEIFKRSKLVLNPSTYNHFSFGPVEAMACGCPMVMFGLPVLYTMGYGGIMIVNTARQFARLVVSYLDSIDNRDKWPEIYARSAHNWAQSWDWSKRAPKVLSEIRGLL